MSGNQVDNPVLVFKLRRPTNKYQLMHKKYLDSDRNDLKVIAKAFAKTFGIGYENMKLKTRGASFMTDDSDYYGHGTNTTYVETWIYLRWAKVYHKIEFYESPHIADDRVIDLVTTDSGSDPDVTNPPKNGSEVA